MTPMKSTSERYLGEGEHVSHSSKKLVLKSETNPGIGTAVYDSEGKKVGKVYDVFGPIDEPFVSIDVDGDPQRLISRKLYISKG